MAKTKTMTKTVTVTRTSQRAARVGTGTSNLAVNITSELRIESQNIFRRVESDAFSTLRKRSMQILRQDLSTW